MKMPVKWLKDYIDINAGAKEIADRLTLSGSNVEEVIMNGDEIKKVVTGRILKIEPHPNADRLVICQVQVADNEIITIVTGADNMKEGDIVPVALNGSVLPGGKKIKKGKLRGVLSNGMMCSAEELGITEDKPIHGLMILKEGTPIGKDIKDVLGLNNAVIDFEITSNRPDCLSILGLALEASAVFKLKLKRPNIDFKEYNDGNTCDLLHVDVKDKLCSRYMAKVIKDVKIQDSPNWMKERLSESGVRPINNIVDITNFVMLELGQPMHAYDSREISQNHIVVERAKDGEIFTTLDEKERKLNSNVLMIKNGEESIGIAGIMGGLNSEIKNDTDTVILESASFDGTNIRVSSNYLSLRSEASNRFEKDIDPNLAETAMKRACHLIEELGAGKVINGTIDIYNNKREEKKVTVDADWINDFLGTEIPIEDMKEYLDSLELATGIDGRNLIVTAPTFRGDINIREDVAEEVARMYGYNNVPSTLMKSTSEKLGESRKQKMDNLLVSTLTASGLNQSISYTFISPKAFDKIKLDKDDPKRKTVVIKNPLGEDYSMMRTTTIPSMLESLNRNYTRNNEYVRLFEIGKTYIPNDDPNKLPIEKNIVSIGMYGKCDYFDLKGIIENVLETFGIKKYTFERESNNKTFNPGRTALLKINKADAGTLGEIHPDVLQNYGIDEKCYVAEIDADLLYEKSNLNKKYKPLPKYPAVSRDMALLVDDSMLVQNIYDIIIRNGNGIVESVKLFDVYRGKQIPLGKKSIAYSISYRADNRTLTDEEVNKVHSKILKALEDEIGAQLR